MAVALCMVVACGTGDESPSADDPQGQGGGTVEVDGDGEVMPAGGATVGAGHVVLYGSYGMDPNGSGHLRRADKVLDLDLASGERRWIELPPDLWVAEAVATTSGLLVVGGPCSHSDVVPVGDDVSCPSHITESHRMDWGSGEWAAVPFDGGLEGGDGFPYVGDGDLVAFDDVAYLVLNTSRDGSSVLVSAGGGPWSPLGEETFHPPPPCATSRGLVLLDRELHGDQVVEMHLLLMSPDGTTEVLDLPGDVALDSFGGISTALACLEDGPLVLHGGASPAEGAPVAAVPMDRRIEGPRAQPDVLFDQTTDSIVQIVHDLDATTIAWTRIGE